LNHSAAVSPDCPIFSPSASCDLYYIELTPDGSLLDRIHRAEKRGWANEANLLVRIRELRNVIAHEYAADKMADLYAATATLAPKLFGVVPMVVAYCERLGASESRS